MRTGRIVRIIGQAAAAGLLGLGLSVAGGQAALADGFEWDTAPATTPAPVISDGLLGNVGQLADVAPPSFA